VGPPVAARNCAKARQMPSRHAASHLPAGDSLGQFRGSVGAGCCCSFAAVVAAAALAAGAGAGAGAACAGKAAHAPHNNKTSRAAATFVVARSNAGAAKLLPRRGCRAVIRRPPILKPGYTFTKYKFVRVSPHFERARASGWTRERVHHHGPCVICGSFVEVTDDLLVIIYQLSYICGCRSRSLCVFLTLDGCHSSKLC
jgi:hypothetical protein